MLATESDIDGEMDQDRDERIDGDSSANNLEDTESMTELRELDKEKRSAI